MESWGGGLIELPAGAVMTAGVAVVLLLAHVTCMSEIAPSLSSALLQTSTASSSLAEAHLTSLPAVSASAAASASLPSSSSSPSSLAPHATPTSRMLVASPSQGLDASRAATSLQRSLVRGCCQGGVL